ncbi:MAG: TonB C-terminal domain-containing protein [Polyangiaceae bacterium]
MRPSESSIPIVLWLCAAVVVHAVMKEGATKAADFGLEQLDLRDFVSSIRGYASGAGNAEPVEVTFAIEAPESEEKKETPPEPEKQKPEEKKTEEKKPEEKKEKQVEAKKEPEPEKKKIQLPSFTPPTPPPPPPPPPEEKKRVAVRQHVEDPNQPDNPDARFAAEQANHVKEETQATNTNHEKDDAKPTPGANRAGPDKEQGNAEKTKVADAENRPGSDNKAPGEHAPKDVSPDHKEKGRPDATRVVAPPQQASLPPSEKEGKAGVAGAKVDVPKAPPAPVDTPKPAPPQGVAPQVPDPITGQSGEYSLNPRRDPGEKPKVGSANTAPTAVASAPPAKPYTLPGLGGGPGPRGININLSPGGAIAAIGEDTLKKERENDGERRKSAHRGSYQAPSLERWKSAIENYVAAVKPGNQTALNTAAQPFATYLNSIHNKLHPIFADEFLDSLDGLPSGHALNQPNLATSLEIVLDKDTGSIVKMGVTRTSGVTPFDLAALESMKKASPFGKPPSSILSTDGNVYLHWEFHRNHQIACSTINAKPYMLNLPPSAAPTTPPAGPTKPAGEKSAPSKEGMLLPRKRDSLG